MTPKQGDVIAFEVGETRPPTRTDAAWLSIDGKTIYAYDGSCLNEPRIILTPIPDPILLTPEQEKPRLNKMEGRG